jgi:hypothetical protein
MPPLTRRILVALWLASLVFILLYLLLDFYSSHSSNSPVETKTPMANLQPLKFLVVPPKLKHTATVIFLHVRSHLISSAYRIQCKIYIFMAHRASAIQAQDGSP